MTGRGTWSSISESHGHHCHRYRHLPCVGRPGHVRDTGQQSQPRGSAASDPGHGGKSRQPRCPTGDLTQARVRTWQALAKQAALSCPQDRPADRHVRVQQRKAGGMGTPSGSSQRSGRRWDGESRETPQPLEGSSLLSLLPVGTKERPKRAAAHELRANRRCFRRATAEPQNRVHRAPAPRGSPPADHVRAAPGPSSNEGDRHSIFLHLNLKTSVPVTRTPAGDGSHTRCGNGSHSAVTRGHTR